MIRAVMLDFDGTLVTKDITDVLCGIVGKEEESAELNKAFFAGTLPGLTGLITRINFLTGVSLAQIQEKLDVQSYLTPGAQELMRYLNEKGIVTILNSGNIMPVLQYYKRLLGITHIVGVQPRMQGDVIEGISEADLPDKDFKVTGVKRILEQLGIAVGDTVAIGDSPADKAMFAFVGTSIAIHPKNGVEEFATFVIQDLTEAIAIIEKLNTA